jgi:hypothetical protein
VVFGKAPATWGNMYITTGPLAVAGVIPGGCAAFPGKFGFCPAAPWGPIPAPGAVCNSSGGAANTCDVSPGGALGICPVGPQAEIACGDVSTPPVGTITYYLAGYNSEAVAPPAAGCQGGNAVFGTSSVFADGGGPGNPSDCYRVDDDASLPLVPAGVANFIPNIPAGVGCP